MKPVARHANRNLQPHTTVTATTTLRAVTPLLAAQARTLPTCEPSRAPSGRARLCPSGSENGSDLTTHPTAHYTLPSPPILQPRYLGHNKLKAVPNNIFNGLTNLLTLELTHNELGNFQGTLLSTNLRLENLHLANNELTSFSTTILTPLKWIKLLNLESNNFNTVPASTYSALNRLEAEYKQTRVCDVGTWQNCRYLKNR